MSRRTGILFGFAGWIAALLIVSVLGLWIAVSHSRKELEAYRTRLENQGETFDIDKLAPPKPPEESNAGPAMLLAAREVADLVKTHSIERITFGQKETTPGLAEVMHLGPTAVRNTKTLEWKDVQSALAPLQAPLQKIREEARAPVLELSLDYSMGFAMRIDDISPLLTVAQFTAQNAAVRLHEGKVSEAAADVETLLRLSGMCFRQPPLICQLVGISIVFLAQTMTWECLQSAQITASDLMRLQDAWQKIHPGALFAASLRMDRALALPAFYASPKSLYPFSSPLASLSTSSTPRSLEELWAMAAFGVWSVVFRYADERQYIENYQALIEAFPKQHSGQGYIPLFETAAKVDASLKSAGISRLFSKMVASSLQKSLQRFAATDTIQNLCLAAIAIRRYQLDHGGAVPPNLADLVPSYLDEVPLDPIDKNPLRYKAESADSFLLYSVGYDGKDDGGNPGKPKSGGLPRLFTDRIDMVWPQPDSKEKAPQQQAPNPAP